MKKVCRRTLAGLLVLAMTLGSWLPVSAEETDAGSTDSAAEEAYAPAMEGTNFFANGIPVVIDTIPGNTDSAGALISWDAGSFEGTETTWDAGSMEVPANTVVYGGGYEGTYTATSVTMNGGTVGAVYGGGVQDEVKETSVVLNSGNVTGEVFGGGECTAVENTYVEVTAAPDADAKDEPAVSAKGIYMGNAADTNVSKKATVVIKNDGNADNSAYTEGLAVSAGYKKIVEENGQEVVAKQGGISDSAKAVVIFDDYNGEFLGTIAEDVDTITVSDTTDAGKTNIVLPAETKDTLASKVNSDVITFAEDDAQPADDSKEESTDDTDKAAANDTENENKAAANDAQPADNAGIQTLAAGDVELSKDYLYWHDLYPDNIKVSRVTAHFYKQDPTGTVGTNQDDVYNAEMTNSSEDVFFVRLPKSEEYQFVRFTYIDENGDSVDIRMTYQFRGVSTGIGEDKEVVDYVAGKKDCIFVGLGGRRSYMSNHVSRETEPLDNHVLYFNMSGSGYQMFTDGDEPYLKLFYGDGEEDFYKITAKATMNEDCYSFVFPENSGLTTATKLRLIDARKNTVGQETLAETRFYYGLANDENMITPANLMNDQPFWGKYETKVSGDTRTIYFDNFLSALSDLKVSYKIGDNGGFTRYYSMNEYEGDFTGSTYVWQYDIPADATQVRFTGTNNGVTWTSENITVSNGYDYPCWYASQDKDSDWYWGGTLAGYWSSLYDVNTQGDNGVNIKSGTFSQGQDVYYATADFYDYYSDSELSGGTPYENDNYSRQGDTFNRALSKYYKANNVGGTAGNTNPNTLYFGSAGTKGLDEEMSQNSGEGLYGYDPNTHQNSWDGSGNTRHTIVDGIVDDTLTDGTMTQGGLKSPLFDSSWLRGSNDYRTALGQVYSNVLFPFTMNNDGYWEFDSAKASDAVVLREDVFEGYYLERTNRPLNNPTTVSDSYGFFPYDDPDTVTSTDGHQRNNMNGVKMSIPFSLTDTKQVRNADGTSEDIKFTFTGDDDVWLFIDGQLVLDLGGIHDTASATINFRTGEITYPNSGTTQTIVNLDSETVNAREEIVKNLDPNTTHTITMFYLERGLEQSNLKMTFNFLQSSQLQVSNKVEIPEEINDVFDEALTHLGGFQYDLKNQAVSGGTTAVENSAGYIKPGNHTVLNATGTSGKEKIEMSEDGDQITYVNTIGQTLDVGSNNQSAIDARLGTIETTFSIGSYEYLRMNVNSSVSSQSGASLYVALVDNSGNRIGGWASAATYESNSNSLYANNWSMVRIDFDKLTQIGETSFNKNNVTAIQIGFRSDATVQIKDLELYEAMQEQPTTGFQVSMDQISDYGSIASGKLSDADGAVYEHYDSSDDVGKVAMVTDGTFALSDGQRAVFTDKFRFGSYIYLNQESDIDIFDTTWTLNEGDSNILAGYLASNRGDMNTVANGNINNLTGVSGTMVNDGRTSIVNNTPVALKGGEGETAFVYRNYADPDDTVTAPVNLKIAYTNTLKYGSVTVEKRIDVTGLKDDEINAYKNSQYEFRLLFRNVAGRALEQQVGDGTDLTATLTVQVGDTVQDDAGRKYLVGKATFDGIPAGTFYEIKEVQQDGISVSSVAAGQGTVEDGQTAHRIWEIKSPDGIDGGENSANITDEEAHVIGIAYNSDQPYVFTNTRTETFNLKVRKDWKTESGTNNGNDEVYVWLQRSVDGGKNWTDVPKPEGYTNPAKNPGDENQYVVRTSGDTHEATFSNLPTLVDGKACKYRVREFTVSNYTPIYSVETDGTLVISNIPTDEVLYVQSGIFNSLKDYVQKAINITGLTSDVKITDANGNDQTNNNELFQITKNDDKNVEDIAYNAPTTGSATFNFEFTFTNGTDTQTANADVLIYAYAIQDDIYVLDYGLPAELSDQNSKDNLFANDTYEIDENTASTYKVNDKKDISQPNGDLEITDDTDTWQTDTATVMYTPKKFMDSVDQFEYTTTIYGEGDNTLTNDQINPTNGVVLSANIKVMPANVVYYDDSFQAGQESGSEHGIVYKGSVDLNIGQDDAVQSIDQDTPYGYDEAFNGVNEDSLGGNAQMNAVSTGTGKDYVNSGSAEFTFTGTGFEVIGRTDQSTTKIQYTVKNMTTNKLVKIGSVDGYYEGNDEEGTTLYQLPVVKLTGLDRDKYKVTLQLLCKSYEKGKEGYFVFDGIRIYNPLDSGETKDYSAKEQGTTVESVRDMILGNSDLADQGVLTLDSIPEGAKAALMSNDGTNTELEAKGATVTEVLGNDSFATNSLDDYLVSGPKGEIYLPGGSAVAFIAEADPNVADKTMQIEAKTVNTSTAGADSVLLNVGDVETQTIQVNSRTAMYYELDMSLCKHIAGNRYLVILTNKPGGADISLTNLKYKGYTISYPTSDLYTVPASVEIGNEIVNAMNTALDTAYGDLATDENIEVTSAYFANRSVEAGDSVYLNVTLKDDSKSYVPVVYHYKNGTLTNITDDNLIDQSTLRAVRSYEKTVDDETAVYRVFRIKLTADDTMSGDEYFAVGAASGNTYCTLDNVKKVAILVEAGKADSEVNEPTGSENDSNAQQSGQTNGIAESSANQASVMSQPTEKAPATSEYSANSKAPALTEETTDEEKMNSQSVQEETTEAVADEEAEVADKSAEIKDAETEDTQVQPEKAEDETESMGLFDSIIQGIKSFFSNISNKLSGLFR